MAWVLLLLFLYLVSTRILRNPKLAAKTVFAIPVVFILYVATISPDLARFIAILALPLFVMALLRYRSKRRGRRNEDRS